MVAKITSGAAIYGALYYNQEKWRKGKRGHWHETA